MRWQSTPRPALRRAHTWTGSCTFEGESITVHADVFGRLVSRGGAILMNANLMDGSAHNRQGGIRVRGVAANAVLQAEDGAVVLERAENCVVSGSRVTIAHALNCEIIGGEVNIGHAEGSAIAGRRVKVESALPRKQGEMLVYVLRAEGPKVEELIAAVGARLARFGEAAARPKAELDVLTAQQDVRRYMMLASRVRSQVAQLEGHRRAANQASQPPVHDRILVLSLARMRAHCTGAPAEIKVGSCS